MPKASWSESSSTSSKDAVRNRILLSCANPLEILHNLLTIWICRLTIKLAKLIKDKKPERWLLWQKLKKYQKNNPSYLKKIAFCRAVLN